LKKKKSAKGHVYTVVCSGMHKLMKEKMNSLKDYNYEKKNDGRSGKTTKKRKTGLLSHKDES